MTSPVIPPASSLTATLQTQSSRQQESQNLSARREADNGAVISASSQTSTSSSSTLTRVSSGDAPRPIDAAGKNEASNNILQFIAQRLAQLQQRGASNEELSEQLDKAKIGFLRGVAQAEEILADKQLLDDDQQQRINNIISRFNEGIERISNNLGLSQDKAFDDEVSNLTESQIVNSDNKNTASTTSGDTKRPSSEINPAQFISRFQETRNTFLRQDSIDLQLRTRDGDIVNISFFASQASASGLRSRSISLGQSSTLLDVTRQFSSYFGQTELQLSVIGEIDDEEFAALESLLSQANEIANAFFNGDDVQAFNQALTLDIDSEEIANFSLDLQSRELQQSTQRYREIAGLAQEKRGDKQSIENTSAQNNGNNINSRKGASLGSLLQQIRDIAIINADQRFEESFVEQLLSINFAAASIDSADIDAADKNLSEDDQGENTVSATTSANKNAVAQAANETEAII